jgi:flagellar hook-length control protein FliK
VSADSDDSTGSGSAAAGNVLPAMITSLLNAAAPAPAPVAPAAGQADSSAVDAISATATLNSSATRLNLAAASVAVARRASGRGRRRGGRRPGQRARRRAAKRVRPDQQRHPGRRGRTPVRKRAPAPASSDSAAPAVDADAAAAARHRRAAARSLVNGARVVTRAADTSAAPAANAPPRRPPAAAPPLPATSAASRWPRPASAPATPAPAAAAPAAAGNSSTVVLNGTPEQWQQPLREALGDRLQVQLQRNNDQAVIRLEPPNMGSIEISIRHSAGALQVNLSANNSEVLRQLNTIGDSVRQDLSNRQFSDVAVTVSSSRAQAQADQGGRNASSAARMMAARRAAR